MKPIPNAADAQRIGEDRPESEKDRRRNRTAGPPRREFQTVSQPVPKTFQNEAQ